MKNKTTLMIVTSIIIISLIIQISAYQLLCLTDGDSVPSKQNPRYTCDHDLCQVCVTNNLYPTHPNYCEGIQNCNPFSGSTGELDTSAPIITITSPVEGFIYNKRSVLFDIKTNEKASIYYIDNINGRGRSSRLASLIEEFYKGISFKDGLNNISIRAIDSNGNIAEITKVFYVDSTKPKISKTEPKKGFYYGEFNVLFVEQNPKSLILTYGNQLNGRKSIEVSLDNCINDNGKYSCTINKNLNEYNGQNIDYTFKLIDIAGNYIESKPAYLNVDTITPVINNPDSLYKINGKDTNLKIDITEKNLEEVSIYDNLDSKPKWKKICSKLNNGLCEKKLSLKKGVHIIDIKVLDQAGNELVKRVTLDINY